jgi:uncharacterized protein with beta-barrel porin domain
MFAVNAMSTLTARGTLGWRHALGDITPVAALAFQSAKSDMPDAIAPHRNQ